MEIYQPEEDSYLLSETLENYLKDLIDNSNVSNVMKDKIVKASSSKKSHKSNSNNLIYSSLRININKKIKDIKIIDMGSGSGIQINTCKKLGFKNIIAVDINKNAIKILKKQKIKAIHSDLFSNIPKNNKFDIIIFNPPYLPEHKYDKEPDTTAGKKGYELIIRFLKQAKIHLTKDGKILLLFSSLSKPNIIKKSAKSIGYKFKLLNKQKLFFEEIFVYEFSI